MGTRKGAKQRLTADRKLRRKALQQLLILDELPHALSKHLLRRLLRLATRIEHTPQAIHLVLNVLGMRNQFFRVAPERVALLLVVLLVLPEVVGDLDEPDARADEDVHVLDVRLHGRHGLDGGCAAADDGDAVVGPLLLLVGLVPARGVDDAALEGVQAGDVGPLEVVQDAGCVEEDVAFFVEVSGFARGSLLTEGDFPFAGFVLPFRADDFGVEGHVFAEVEDVDDFVEVLVDVGGVGEEPWPIRV